jgi:hypothetical protein
MRIRAKMFVQSLNHCFGSGIAVKLSPVTSGSEENKRFFQATPNGSVELHLSPAAAAEIGISTAHIGQEFYVDLTPAPKPVAA